MNPSQLPSYETALVTKSNTTKAWYTWFAGLSTGQPSAVIATVTVGSTPFVYLAPVAGTLFISGGTTSAIAVSRDGQTFYPTGFTTGGAVPLSQGDSVKITYAVAPPVAQWFPR